VPCYAGGIDLDLSVEALLKQTDDNVAKGFRAIKMKVGRPDLASDVTRVQAMRKHLGNGFPLMADANMKWTVEEAIRHAPLRPAGAHLVGESRTSLGQSDANDPDGPVARLAVLTITRFTVN